MNFENNGKKVAAILCVASSFPVVAAVYAMETQPGWHGDKYIKEDATVAKGWEEIEGKSYYFSEKDGSVDKETTKSAVVATVSTEVANDVQQSVSAQTKTIVSDKVEDIKEQQAIVDQQNTLSEDVDKENVASQDEVQSDDIVADTPTEEAPVVPETPEVQDIPGVQEEVQPNLSEEVVTPSTPVVPEEPEQEVTPQPEVAPQPEVVPQPEVTPQPEVVPQPEIQAPVNPADPYADLNARIAAEAQKLVGVTDGLWCTQVVQLALANAGVSDALQLWPDQYFQYGYETNDPQPGNLIYYNNGGRGVDHIAIYIGNGLAVHGNYMQNGQSKTVIASVYEGGGGTPQFIQVQR